MNANFLRITLLGLACSTSSLANSISTNSLTDCQGSKVSSKELPLGVYIGNINKMPIVLQLSKYDGQKYFYAHKGLDIELVAKQQGDKLILEEVAANSNRSALVPSACFSLSKIKGDQLAGDWQALAGGKKLAVTLRHYDPQQSKLHLPNTAAVSQLREDDPYNFAKLNRPWKVSNDGQTWQEPLSGTIFNKLKGASAKLNNTLFNIALVNASNKLSCKAFARLTDAEYDVKRSKYHKTKQLISFEDTIYSYCGGPHPNIDNRGFIVEQKTGQRVTLGKIWPLLTKQLPSLYLSSLKASQDMKKECLEIVSEATNYTTYLAAGGLNIVPSLPHVAQACAETVTLPYSQLKKYANADGRYFKDFY